MAKFVCVSACENKNNSQKPKLAMLFSHSEIEAARQLIQLRSRDSDIHYDEEEDHHSHSTRSTYSMQWKPQQPSNKADDDTSGGGVGGDGGGDMSSSTTAIEDVLAEAEDDERFRRRNKRYRYIQDLYNVKDPVRSRLVPAVKAKKMKCSRNY